MDAVEDTQEVIVDLDPAILRWQYVHGERLTLERLAEAVGVSTSTICRLHAGKTRRPDLDLLSDIASFLDCKVTDLLRKVGEHKRLDLEDLEVR